ncbi:MAG: putative peptidoglycan binding domain-containing protein, partial [Pseudomonadota bacterium]
TLCSMKRADEAMLQYRRAIQRGAFDAVGWQTFLSEAGFYSGEIDGVFGQGSMRALQSWVAATCR